MQVLLGRNLGGVKEICRISINGIMKNFFEVSAPTPRRTWNKNGTRSRMPIHRPNRAREAILETASY